MFQDAAGTQPVTAPGQSVGLVLDKSRGSLVPRRNLYRYSQTMTNTNWQQNRTTVAPSGTTSTPRGVLPYFKVTATGNDPQLTQYVTTGPVANRTFTLSFVAWTDAGQPTEAALFFFGTTGVEQVITVNITLTTTPTVYTLTGSFTGTAASSSVTARIDLKEIPTIGDYIYVTAAQFEEGASASAYQETADFPVAWVGNHATQATAAARPTYGVEPLGGRRNILPRNQWDAIPIGVMAADYTDRGQYLVGPNAAVGISAEVVGKGVTDGISWVDIRYYGTNTSGTPKYPYIGSNTPQKIPAGATKFSVSHWVQLVAGSLSAGTALYQFLNGRDASLASVVGPVSMFVPTATWQRFSAANLAVPVNMVETANCGMYLSINAGATFDVTLRIGGGQVEFGSTVTALQNAASIYDVTEAGVPSLSYLSFDGVDDFLVTPTITPGTDKVQVFVGVRKLSDPGSLAAAIVESSVQADANNGALFLFGRDTFTPAMYEFGTRGTTFRLADTNNSSFAAPVTGVLTGIGDIAGDVARLRVNGSQVAETLTDQGTGNYLAYPIYIGRRGGTTLPFNGRIYGLIVRFGANLTSDQITQTEMWMNSKTGAY